MPWRPSAHVIYLPQGNMGWFRFSATGEWKIYSLFYRVQTKQVWKFAILLTPWMAPTGWWGRGFIGLGSSNLAGRITMLKTFLAYSVASCKGFLPICFQFYREFISSAGKTLTIPVYRVHAWWLVEVKHKTKLTWPRDTGNE